MSSPVSTNSTELRWPPSSLTQTLSRSGGADPRTPVTRTRSEPTVRKADRGQVGRHVRPEVLGALHLVEQLSRDRVDRDRAARADVLGDHRRPVGRHLREREAPAAGTRSMPAKPGEVAAGRLAAALDDVPGDDGAGQGVVRRRLPAVPPDGRPDHEGSVGDPAGHHDVGTACECCGDAEPAEVGVGGQSVLEAQASARRRRRRTRWRATGRAPWPPRRAGRRGPRD